ncbi:unnamed protein product [Alternaria alternata]
MNVERCIELHNEIVQHGWVGSGRSPETLTSQSKSWFQLHGEKAEAARSDLSAELIQFLEQAQDPYAQESETCLVILSLGIWSLWTKLYVRIRGLAVAMGLRIPYRYDQKTNLCILALTLYDMDGMDERKWYPLETVLSFWLSQIRQGSIQATPERGGKLREEWPALRENRDPSNWVFVPYNEVMMKRNLEIWDKLVEAIESHMPMESISAQPICGILENNVRKTISLPQRFAYNFLFRARRPRFKKIAPGLRVITSSDFPDQPFRSHMSKDKDEIPPILLFRSELNFFENPTWNPRDLDARMPHFFDYRDPRRPDLIRAAFCYRGKSVREE